MPTKRNRRVGVQSRKVKKQKKLSRKLSVSGKAKRRGSSTHRSGTRRRVQRGGVFALPPPTTPLAVWAYIIAFGASGILLHKAACATKLLKCPDRKPIEDDGWGG
jgi:hypothetical protein